MNTNFAKMLVSLQVTKIFNDTRTCNVKVTMNPYGKEETILLKDVYIEGLLKVKFNDPENEKFRVGVKYTAVNNSTNYDECPIKLRRTCNMSTGNMYFSLTRVNTGRSIPRTYTSPLGTKINTYEFTTIPSSKWKRYADNYERLHEAYLKKIEKLNAVK